MGEPWNALTQMSWPARTEVPRHAYAIQTLRKSSFYLSQWARISWLISVTGFLLFPVELWTSIVSLLSDRSFSERSAEMSISWNCYDLGRFFLAVLVGHFCHFGSILIYVTDFYFRKTYMRPLIIDLELDWAVTWDFILFENWMEPGSRELNLCSHSNLRSTLKISCGFFFPAEI